MDDIIRLMADGEPTYDEELNEKPNIAYRTVFCRIESVTRSEFYQAAQQNLHPTVIFVLSNSVEYNGEKTLEWTDPKGKTHVYDIIRTYNVPDKDELELTVEERIGENGEDSDHSDAESS